MFTESHKATAQEIWQSITVAKKVLLHCHVSPDGDSIGSTLALYHALKDMGKEVVAIWGDSGPVQQFYFLPGFNEIVNKNYFEIDLESFDLFIIQDSASIDRISMKGQVVFPSHMKTIVIDHHVSNTQFANINLIPDNAPATAVVLYELFVLWEVHITKHMAIALMVGMFTDTGGFRFRGVTSRVFEIMADLTRIEPAYPEYIVQFESDIEYGRVAYLGLAYNSIETYCGGKVILSSVSYEQLLGKGLVESDTQKQPVPNILKSIKGAVIGIECAEGEPDKVKFSFRTQFPEKYNLSTLATALGGGGHKAAAGVLIPLSLEDAKKKVLDKVRELYPDLA